MENCVVRNHAGVGIVFEPGADSRLSVSDTLVADNGGGGILVFALGAGAVKVAINRAEVSNNSRSGIRVDGGSSTGTVSVTVADSVSVGNLDKGIVASSDGAMAPTSVIVVRSVISNNNSHALFAFSAKARLVFGQSAISGNGITWGINLGVLQSFGDNYIAGNADGDPAPPTIAKK